MGSMRQSFPDWPCIHDHRIVSVAETYKVLLNGYCYGCLIVSRMEIM